MSKQGTMMMNVKQIGLLTAGLLLCGAARAENDRGGRSGEFLQSASGARVLGMGKAVTSIVDGPSSLLWNAAGLGFPFRNAVSLSHVRLYGDASLSELSLAYSGDRLPMGLGASFVQFAMPDIETRDNNNNLTGSTRDSKTGMLVGVGAQPLEWLALGANAKSVRQSLGDASGLGYDCDLGAMARLRALHFGLALDNALGAKLSRAGGHENLPRIVRGGAGVDLFGMLTVAADYVKSEEEPQGEIRAGAEARPLKWVALRGGYDGDFVTAGGGITWSEISFDYALIKQESLGMSHRFSLTIAFGPDVGDKRRESEPAEPVGPRVWRYAEPVQPKTIK